MRDTVLTMSNEQDLAVVVDDNMADTPSTVDVPNPPVGENEPSGDTPVAGLEWIVTAYENTTVPIQVEGTLLARLQMSDDLGVTWASVFTTEQEQEMQLAEDSLVPDPCLSVRGQVIRRQRVGHRFREELGIVDLTLIRFRTVYSTTGREAGDAAATVTVTSYLANAGGP